MSSTKRAPGVWRLGWRVANHRPGLFWMSWSLFVMFFTFPVLNGWLLGRGFHALETGHQSQVYWYAAGALVTDALRMACIHGGALSFTRVWVHMQTFLRANMMTAQLASGGPEAGQPVG